MAGIRSRGEQATNPSERCVTPTRQFALVAEMARLWLFVRSSNPKERPS